jgi:hypothetical protein
MKPGSSISIDMENGDILGIESLVIIRAGLR